MSEPKKWCKYRAYPMLGSKNKWCNIHQEDCIGYENCVDALHEQVAELKKENEKLRAVLLSQTK